VDNSTNTPLRPTCQPKRWAPMTLTFVGNVGVVMETKTGANTDSAGRTLFTP